MGFPQPIPPTPLSPQVTKDIETLITHIPRKYRDWWNDWLVDQPLPSEILSEGLFFNFLS